MGNVIFQWLTQLCRMVWSSFSASQVMPGVLWINVTFVTATLCGIISGIMQGGAENGVRMDKPGEFPPSPADIAMAAFKEERKRRKEELRRAKSELRRARSPSKAQQSPGKQPAPQAQPVGTAAPAAPPKLSLPWTDPAAPPAAGSTRSSTGDFEDLTPRLQTPMEAGATVVAGEL